jgi:ABC-type anion transport system duplicated permease subunit
MNKRSDKQTVVTVQKTSTTKRKRHYHSLNTCLHSLNCRREKKKVWRERTSELDYRHTRFSAALSKRHEQESKQSVKITNIFLFDLVCRLTGSINCRFMSRNRRGATNNSWNLVTTWKCDVMWRLANRRSAFTVLHTSNFHNGVEFT